MVAVKARIVPRLPLQRSESAEFAVFLRRGIDECDLARILALDQQHVANARSVFLPDGRQVLAGSSFDTSAPAAAAPGAAE